MRLLYDRAVLLFYERVLGAGGNFTLRTSTRSFPTGVVRFELAGLAMLAPGLRPGQPLRLAERSSACWRRCKSPEHFVENVLRINNKLVRNISGDHVKLSLSTSQICCLPLRNRPQSHDVEGQKHVGGTRECSVPDNMGELGIGVSGLMLWHQSSELPPMRSTESSDATRLLENGTESLPTGRYVHATNQQTTNMHTECRECILCTREHELCSRQGGLVFFEALVSVGLVKVMKEFQRSGIFSLVGNFGPCLRFADTAR